MNKIAAEVDAKLQSLDERHAAQLEAIIRRSIAWFEAKREENRQRGVENGWPVGYFDNLEGVFANEPFERPEQSGLQASNERNERLRGLFGSCQADSDDLDAFLASNREQRLASRTPIELRTF